MTKRFFGIKLMQAITVVIVSILFAGVAFAAEGDAAPSDQAAPPVETNSDAEVVVESNSSQSSQEGASSGESNTTAPAEEPAPQQSETTYNSAPAQDASSTPQPAYAPATPAASTPVAAATPNQNSPKSWTAGGYALPTPEEAPQELDAVPMNASGMGFPGSLPSPALPTGSGLFLAALQSMRYFPMPALADFTPTLAWVGLQSSLPLHYSLPLAAALVLAAFVLFMHAGGYRGAGRSDVPGAASTVFLFCYSTVANCLGKSLSSSSFFMGSETKMLTNTTL